MYGKHFASMYERSMVGTGAIVFAVWGYVIATARPDKNIGAQVTINPDLLAAILGEKTEDVQRAIDFLCSPDPRSTSKQEEGRRLVKLGEFDYRVVNYAKYRAIRDEEMRREQNRFAQERFRERMRGKKGKSNGKKARWFDDETGEKGLADVNSRCGETQQASVEPTNAVENGGIPIDAF